MIRATITSRPDDHPLTYSTYVVICCNNFVNNSHVYIPFEVIFRHTKSRQPEKTLKSRLISF